tara:strand:- start:195 stop:407 length:213 start_codon:yes stop_codon:yes gene_type:complete
MKISWFLFCLYVPFRLLLMHAQSWGQHTWRMWTKMKPQPGAVYRFRTQHDTEAHFWPNEGDARGSMRIDV